MAIEKKARFKAKLKEIAKVLIPISFIINAIFLLIDYKLSKEFNLEEFLTIEFFAFLGFLIAFIVLLLKNGRNENMDGDSYEINPIDFIVDPEYMNLTGNIFNIDKH